MTPIHATLAAVAALAAAGKLKKRGSRGLKTIPPGYHVSSYWAVKRFMLAEDLLDGEWYSEDDEEWEPGEYDTPPDPEYRLYHVTTAADRVLTQGIKSRNQLRSQRGAERSYGLGGGLGGHEAPHLVSAAIDLTTAERIYRAIRVAVKAARREMKPHKVAIECFQWVGFPGGLIEAAEIYFEKEAFPGRTRWDEIIGRVVAVLTGNKDHIEQALADDYPNTTGGWVRWIQEHAAEIDAEWDSKFQNAYGLIYSLEREFGSLAQDFPEYYGVCESVVGFTESWENMAKTNLDQVKILALATKAEAVEVVPKECEARFNPRDLIVLGVVNPRRAP